MVGKRRLKKPPVLPSDHIKTIVTEKLFNEHNTLEFKGREGFNI